jgi:hypothetical protein
MKKILTILFCFVAVYIKACECPPIEPINKVLADKYDVIFYGKVDSIVPCGTKGIGTAYFSIINLYKGHAEQHISVDYDCTSSCMMSFSKNEEWIIYAVYQRFDLLTVDLCSHSRKRNSANETDHYQVSSGRSFEEENNFLKKILGLQVFSSHNELNDKQKDFKPHNDQPSALNKLALLIVSLLVMMIIYIISKKLFKNDK